LRSERRLTCWSILGLEQLASDDSGQVAVPVDADDDRSYALIPTLSTILEFKPRVEPSHLFRSVSR
jgi:hypothetical protein